MMVFRAICQLFRYVIELPVKSLYKVYCYFFSSAALLIDHPVSKTNIRTPTSVVIADNAEHCRTLINKIKEKIKVYSFIGLDCEWISLENVRKPVSLIQIATTDGFCILLRVFKYNSFPLSLKELLEDETITKVGCGMHSDAFVLQVDQNVRLSCCVDVATAMRHVGRSGDSLRTIAHEVLDLDMDKTLSESHWELPELMEVQKRYAALDALAPLKILERLYEIEVAVPLDRLDDEELQTSMFVFWRQVMVKGFVFKHVNKLKTGKSKNKSEPRKQATVRKSDSNSVLKSKLYDNCYIQDSMGNVLSVCNNRKIDWYISKGLGIEICDNPRTVQLKFLPVGYTNSKDCDYYKIPKENKCVVCGSTTQLLRKQIVPEEYKLHFPVPLKSYKSHDVLLLCIGCHRVYTNKQRELKARLLDICNLSPDDKTLQEKAKKWNEMKSAARALKRKHSIPPERVRQLEAIVREFFPNATLDESSLNDIAKTQLTKKPPTDGWRVVNYFESKESINKLEMICRKHFVESMEPKYLPELWSISHQVDAIRVSTS